MKTVSAFLLLLFGIITSCKKDDSSTVCNIDYFPLQVGNIWHYTHYVTEVTKKVELNNKEYFEVESKYIVTDTVFSSYKTYYRRTENGQVYMLDNNSDTYEKLYYNTCVSDNYSWTFKSTPDAYSAWEVTKTTHEGSFIINDQEIGNCIQFFYDLKEAVDDEHSIILAPGIGRIASSSIWGINDSLKSATINGIEYRIK
jgi:hypothetical protein